MKYFLLSLLFCATSFAQGIFVPPRPGGGGSGTATNLAGNALVQVTNIAASLASSPTSGVTLVAFNQNQFNTNNNAVAIRLSAFVTNLTIWGTTGILAGANGGVDLGSPDNGFHEAYLNDVGSQSALIFGSNAVVKYAWLYDSVESNSIALYDYTKGYKAFTYDNGGFPVFLPTTRFTSNVVVGANVAAATADVTGLATVGSFVSQGTAHANGDITSDDDIIATASLGGADANISGTVTSLVMRAGDIYTETLSSNTFVVVSPGGILNTGIFGSGFSYNAATRTVTATGGAQTPWASDIDGAGYSLTNANSVVLQGTGATLGELELYSTNGNDRINFSSNTNAVGTNSLRFDFSSIQAGQVPVFQAPSTFGPTNVVVVTNAFMQPADSGLSNLANSSIDVPAAANVVSNVANIKYQIQLPAITVSNILISGNTNNYELVGLTNVVLTNIVEEATGVNAKFKIVIRNTLGVSVPLVWPAFGAQHGYYFHTNGLNDVLSITVVPPGTNTVVAGEIDGTNVYVSATHWRHP